MLRKILGVFTGSKKDRQEKKAKSGLKFTGNVDKDEKILKEIFDNCQDVKFRRLTIPALENRQGLAVEVEELVNKDVLNRDILTKLMEPQQGQVKGIEELIPILDTARYTCPDDLAREILTGKVGIIVQGEPKAYAFGAMEIPSRSVEEPLQERLIRGPREGFTEVIKVNMALVRRRLPDPRLKIIGTEVGRRTKTKVSVLYIEDICNPETVGEIEGRIKGIDIDGIMETGELAELITQRPATIFPLFMQTERPDKVAAELLQGRVAIMVDGSSFAMLAPVTFSMFLQTPADYYMHPFFALTSRLIRFAGLILGTTLVAAYVAMITFHYEIIPTNILIFIAQSREGVPFDPLTEALLLEFASDLLREASIRLPGPIGPTLGIVGALILGEAAVAAHLVSPVLLFLVALTFILDSIIPNYDASIAIRNLRYPLLVAGGLI